MSKLYTLVFLFILMGCVKKKEEAMVANAMTNGQWKVTNFKKGAADVTTDFSTYLFQFKTNYTVDAINNGTIEKTGSWNADASAQTITSTFPNAANPIVLLNGTWQITNNSWTWVEATQTVNGEVQILRLDKQ